MHKHFLKKSAIWKIISKKNFTKADKTRSETLLENRGMQWEDQCKSAHSSHNPGSIQYSTSGSRSAKFITPSLFLAWMCQPPLTSPLVVLVYLHFSVYFCSLPGYIASGRSNWSTYNIKPQTHFLSHCFGFELMPSAIRGNWTFCFCCRHKQIWKSDE